MSYRIDDDENRIQDLKDKVDQLEVQTFSPEVVARNESTRNTGISSGDSATLNPFPLKPPIADFGTIGGTILLLFLDRVDSHAFKMTIDDDESIQFIDSPKPSKMMDFVLDITMDGTGGHVVDFVDNVQGATTIDSTANARTVLRLTTTDGGVTFFAENISTGGGTGGDVTFPIDFPPLDMGSPTVSAEIDFALSDRHFRAIGLSDNLQIDLTNIPTDGALCTIYFTQDGSGGHVPTIPLLDNSGELDNIDTTPNSTTVFTIQAVFGTILGFTSGKEIFFGSDVSQWSTFSAEADVNFNTFDGINIDRLRFVPDSGVPVSSGDPSIFLSSVSNMVFNIAGQKQFFWAQNDTTLMALDQSGVNNDTILTVQTDTADTSAIPFFNIFRDDPTPQSGIGGDSEIAEISFIGTNAATNGGASVSNSVYSKIISIYESVISGQEAASLNFFTSFDTGIATQLKPFLGLNNFNSEEIDAFVDLNMQSNRIVDVSEIQGDDSVTFQIGFDTTDDNDTFMSSRSIFPDRVDMTVNGINAWLWTFDTTLSEVAVGLVEGTASHFLLTDHAVYINTLTEIPDANLSNNQGGIFFNNSTDPGILTIKKKDSFGAVSLVSLEASGGTSNEILEGDSSVTVNDVGFGVINFQVDNTPLGSVTTALGWVLENDLTLVSGKLNVNNNFIQFSEIVLPANPAADTGIMYVRDVVGITTPFFLDSAGTETSMIGTGGASPLTTKGDIFTFDTADARLPVGTDGQILTANSAVALGVEWDDINTNQIIDGDSKVIVVDATPAIAFNLNGSTVSILSLTEWLFGQDLDMNQNEILNPSKILLGNGFLISNFAVSETTFEIPDGETLTIKEGVDERIKIANTITFDAEANNNFIFNENGVQVALYDGLNDNWILNPANDVQLSPTIDIDLTPGNDIIMNPTGDIRVFEDLDMQSQSTVDFDGFSSVPVGSAIGAIQIKVSGVIRLVKFYST